MSFQDWIDALTLLDDSFIVPSGNMPPSDEVENEQLELFEEDK